ncbi:uncharacterized protein LOC118459851 isoform X2 [Anopheles albimanus]|uniref:uncharacterized protein LOC118459851 isoform X2 n=1 Tax=Anopheles albimanus TaxID=7167 RepID=UPI001641803B|nr:uncharacterized protein LOC118459851 isoform X2 [Anopheles albimanus]
MGVAARTTFTVLVLLLLGHRKLVSALRCHQCGWDTCGTNEELIECTLERVNSVHANFQQLTNVSQYHELPQGPAEFMCFELRLANAHGNRTGTIKSCTLRRANLCGLSSWRMVKVLGCRTCNDEDYCNGFDAKPALPDRSRAGIGFSFSAAKTSSGRALYPWTLIPIVGLAFLLRTTL